MSQKVTRARIPAQAPHFPLFFKPRLRLSELCRLLDDITPAQAALIANHCGGDPARILEVGYGVVSPAFLQQFEPAAQLLRRGSIVLACRDAGGEVVGLHDHCLQWLTPATVHIANPIRAPWTEIQICETTSQADSLALSENICAIGRNGFDKKTVATAVLSARRSGTSLDVRRLAA
jgi:hypothetical protein